jgi:hypothetical protein
VLRLAFRSSAPVVDLLKRVLRDARPQTTPWPSCGGWLKGHSAWFGERTCWPAVRRELERAGYTVVVAAACR